MVDGRTVIDTERALLVHRPGLPPTLALPAGDVGGVEAREEDAAAGHVSVAPGAVDAWYEEDELLQGHPRNPYHRVDCLRSSRHLRAEGTVLAAREMSSGRLHRYLRSFGLGERTGIPGYAESPGILSEPGSWIDDWYYMRDFDHLRSRLPALAPRMIACETTPAPARLAAPFPSIFLVNADTPDVSSTEIRRRARAGEALVGLVPDAVATYIVAHHLYV